MRGSNHTVFGVCMCFCAMFALAWFCWASGIPQKEVFQVGCFAPLLLQCSAFVGFCSMFVAPPFLCFPVSFCFVRSLCSVFCSGVSDHSILTPFTCSHFVIPFPPPLPTALQKTTKGPLYGRAGAQTLLQDEVRVSAGARSTRTHPEICAVVFLVIRCLCFFCR